MMKSGKHILTFLLVTLYATESTTVASTTTPAETTTSDAETTPYTTTDAQTTTDVLTTSAVATTSDATTTDAQVTLVAGTTSDATTTDLLTTVEQTTTDAVITSTVAETTSDATTVEQTTTDAVITSTVAETISDATTVEQTTTDAVITSTVAETTSDATTVGQTTTDAITTSTAAETTSDATTVEQTTTDAVITSTVAETTSDATTIEQTTTDAVITSTVAETTSDATTVEQTTTDAVITSTVAETTSDATTVEQTTTDAVITSTVAETTSDATTVEQTTTDAVITSTVAETTSDATTVEQTTMDDETTSTVAETTSDATTVGQTTTDAVTTSTVAETTSDATTVEQTTTDAVITSTVAETTSDATTVGQTTTDAVTTSTVAETTSDATTVGQTTTDAVTTSTVAETTSDATTVEQTTTDAVITSTVAETTSDATTVGQTTTDAVTTSTVAETTSDATTVGQTTTDAVTTSTVAETTSDATTVEQTTTDAVITSTVAETTSDATTVGQTTTDAVLTSTVAETTSDATTVSQTTTDAVTTSTVPETTSDATTVGQTTTDAVTTSTVVQTTADTTTVGQTTTDAVTTSTVPETTSDATTVGQTTTDALTTSTVVETTSDATTVGQTTTDALTSSTVAETTSDATTFGQTTTDAVTTSTIAETTSDASTVGQTTTDAITTSTVAETTSDGTTDGQTTTDAVTTSTVAETTSDVTTVGQTTTDAVTTSTIAETTSDATTVGQTTTDALITSTEATSTITSTQTTSGTTTVDQTTTGVPTTTSDATTVEETTTDTLTSSTIALTTSEATTVDQTTMDVSSTTTDFQSSSVAQTSTDAPTSTTTEQTSEASTATQTTTDGPTSTVTQPSTDGQTSTTVGQTSEATTDTQTTTDGLTSTTIEQTSEASTVTQTTTDRPTSTTVGQTSEATTVTQSTTDAQTTTVVQTTEATTTTQTPTDGQTSTTVGQTSEATTVTQTTTDGLTSTTIEQTSEASTVTQTPTDRPTSTTVGQTSEATTVTQSTTDAQTTTVVQTTEASTATQTPTDGQTSTTVGQTSEASTVTQTTTDGPTSTTIEQTSEASTVTQTPTDGPTSTTVEQTSEASTVTQTPTDGPTSTTVEQTSEASTVTQTPTNGPTSTTVEQTSEASTVTQTTTDGPTSTTVEQTSEASTVTQTPTDGPSSTTIEQTSEASTVTQTSTDGPTSTTVAQTSEATTVTQTPTVAPTTVTTATTTVPLPSTDATTTSPPVIIPGLLFDYGPGVDSRSMSGTDDGCDDRVDIDYSVPFRNKKFRTIYVCANGLLCFNRKYESYTVPANKEFKNDLLNIYCLAPYFADINLSNAGRVWYTSIDYTSDKTANTVDTEATEERVHALVNEIYGNDNFSPAFFLKATWEEGPRYGGPESETVTFQAVFTSDGKQSYTFYSYSPGNMSFTSGSQFIGLLLDGRAEGLDDSSDGSYLRRPDQTLILEPYQGASTFRLAEDESDEKTNFRVQCRKWHKKETKNKVEYQTTLNQMPQCPCSANFLFFDRQFGPINVDWSTASFTAPVLPRADYAPNGKTCAYSFFTGSFISTGVSAGSFNVYNSLSNPRENAINDAYYKNVCCQQSDLCNLYYDVRPTHSCYSSFPFSFANAFGDPHIATLDGFTYTFNGHGEYILLKIPTVGFEVQARTDRAITADNTSSEATIFTAFAIQSAGAWVQVELDANKTGLDVFVGENNTYWADLTGSFYDDGNSFSYVTDSLSLSKDDKTLTASFAGISFNVTTGVGLLQMNAGLSNTYRTLTEGLLGNFNNDATDDLIPRGLTVPIASTSTGRQIFEDFGSTWITTSEESIFKYSNGISHADYSFPDFVPKFLDEANQTLVTEATDFCGEGNNQCIFDLVFTGNNELAADTTATETQAAENAADASNIIPALIINSGITSIDGENYLYTTLNEPVNFTLLGTDDGTLTYQFVNNTAGATLGSPQDDGTIDVSLLLSNTDPVFVSVTAEDDRGLSAPVIDVVVVLCTGCNDHGVCNHSLIRDDVTATDSFKYATCVCTSFWTGTDCETDFDGCAVNPCSVGRTCTDNSAQVHESTGIAYTCSPCPSGYQDSDDKCFDIDECNDVSTNNCSQICVNTDGSYYCQCNAGYRLNSDGYACNDINECEESTSTCDQICTNTDGAFDCSCFFGFQFNALTQTCDQDVVPLCNALDCSNADGCSLNDIGSAVCICNNGYQLQDDNSCTNVDECTAANSVCSQSCQDTVGSFTCSCYTGYKLETDGNTCSACEFPAYGDSCSSTCQCGRGSTGCDNVSGCQCEAGWTGTICDTDVDECLDANICGDSNKVCTNTIGSYTCTCRSGFSLVNGTCTDIDECEDPTLDDCQQVCSNTIGGYSCSCTNGFVIDSTNSTKCLDFDECAVGISGCEQMCINFDGRSSCECYFGFLLNSDRKTCSKVMDPCIDFPDSNCSDICLVVDGAPVCSCCSGYTLGADQKNCIDINECDAALGLNACSDPDSCVNSDGGYECSCVEGFKLENDQRTCKVCDEFHYGLDCSSECNCGVGATRCDSVTGCVCSSGWLGEKCDVDKDECQIFPTVCTGVQEECTNIPGSYSCNCESGYQKNNNDICTDIDECSSTELNYCSQICTNTVGGYQCSCHSGFQQNGTQCNDINECDGQNDCTQVCTNNVGYYRCSCDTGFKLDIIDKITCIPENSCDPTNTTCGANTECAIISNVETCSCQAGYQFVSGSSLVCEDIPECSADPSPCSQECQELQGSYMCSCDLDGFKLDTDQSTCIVCPDGTYGDDCLQNCTCGLHTLSCDPVNGTCNCDAGWTGVFCTQDINECSNSAIHQCPLNSVCINTPGSFDCRCNDGYLKSSDGSCQVCDSTHWGTNCANNCSCVEDNTDRCDPVDGTCTCKTGWSDSTCSSDVDECDANPSICGDALKTCQNTVGSYTCVCNSGYTINNLDVCIDDNECLLGTSTCVYQCTNTPGTFECSCYTGYTGTGNTCTPCAFGFWGVQCANTCGCNSTNTIECDAATGCTCRSGFTGTTCDDDIDECTTGAHSCPADSTCINIHGSHQCDCNIGFLEDANGLCQECSNDTYGNDCQSSCDCENNNSINPGQSCDHLTGTCQCTAYWNGTRCETDINECAAGTSNCDLAPNQGCHNTEGGFLCSCLLYYEPNANGVCIEDPDWAVLLPLIPGLTTVRVTITLNYIIPPGTDLNVFATFEYYAAEIRTRFLSFFRTSMGVSLNNIAVRAVTDGSLKTNVSLLFIDDVESAQNFATAISLLQTGSEVQIFNQQTTTQELVLNDDTIVGISNDTDKKILCAGFLAARGSNCDSSSECVIVDDLPTCQPRKTTDNFGLVIGLGVGIPLFLIAALIVGVVIIYSVKSRRKQRYHTEDMDRGSFNNGFFPHMMPTKINTWGRGDPVGIYGPNTWDDESASTASDDGKQYRRGRDMLRSDEVYRAYDNDNGPVSNFSWDFLYNYIHPHERYEIQRPQHEQHPHPVFTS